MEPETAITTPTTRNPRSLRSTLWIVGAAFVAGLAMMGWGLSNWDAGRNWLAGSPAPRPAPVIAYTPPIASTPALSLADPAQRMALLEARVAQLEASGVEGGNAGSGRAEALLSAFAARRALERGLALGYVEGLLSQHFGQSQPRAVATVIAAARQPATLEDLRRDLAALTPALGASPPDQGWWEATTSTLGGLFQVREQGETPPDPKARVALAEGQIAAGRVDLALAEVARLPTRDAAAQWMAAARRYIEANRALDILEAAAITAQQLPTP